MSRGTGRKGRNAFRHIKCRQHKVHRLNSLEEVISREPGTPYTMLHLPDTGRVVLAPVDEGGDGACPVAPSLWEKTAAAVWRLPSHHLPRIEAQYLAPHLVEGVPWEDVWAMM